ncbi:hypothetical protein PAXINDRAFT_103402 [Paxillus involutus ATCC 200175]|uniref:Uncharacterized protein n=1 Tax=Paxillus involutus ATCC 200175 TaxID=664439 RepID=A0A0C9T4N5_PAXIN|nr:hypothetical protein PAXINDRAFT_103402 [Paxillus involutus ATCC 200175]
MHGRMLPFLLLTMLGIALAVRKMSWQAHSALLAKETGPPSTDPACANPPMDQCSFYATCLESRYHCGPDGYPLGYGRKYCQKFAGERSKLDPQGQKWMIDTMHCLQLVLVPDAIDANSTTCDALKDQAFASHAGCYVSNGFCTLGVHDWAAIIEIVGITTPFANWDALKATMQAIAYCTGFYGHMAERGWGLF